MMLATLTCGLYALAGGQVPSGAVILFDGKDTSEWVHRRSGEPCKWRVENGELVVTANTADIVTKREFSSYRLHLEFWLPLEADHRDQARANSGVYNQGRWEIQILDLWKNSTYPMGGCGAIYAQKDPDKDAIKPPGWWNTYDFVFRAARFKEDGSVASQPRISVWHNGIRIHNDVELKGTATTAGLEGPMPHAGPILLQNHGSAIRFRNIWIVPM